MTFVAATGTARIRHARTGEVFEIDADELDFEAIGADERNMGPEVHHQADMEHPQLGLLIWSLWEYPIGIENMQETAVGEHELLENIDFGLQHEPDYEEPPEDPPDLTELLTRLPSQLAALDAALDRLAETSGQMGHNMPPSEFQLRLDDDDLARLRESIVAVQGQLGKPDPAETANVEVLTSARSRLSGFGAKLGGVGKWGGLAIGAGVLTGIGKGIGDQIWTEIPALHLLVHAIIETLSVWIHALMTLL